MVLINDLTRFTAA